MRVLQVIAAAAAAQHCGANYDALVQLFKQQANATIAQVASPSRYPANGACPSCYGWATSDNSGWTIGFFPGLLFRLYNYSTNIAPSPDAAHWLQMAQAWSTDIAPNQFNTGTHDVGFMVVPTFVAQYRLTGNTTARDIAITTAHSLAVRFSPVVGCIRSWGSLTDADFEVIVDNMMNLELLWWAAAETGNATFLAQATSHANRMISDIYQPFSPGCVWHLLQYNASSGALMQRSSTPQGLGNNTVWSRGQAWAVHGFTIAYRYTGNPSYLSTAMSSAECFMRLLTVTSTDNIPPWDFNATGVEYHKDTSAAAIATSAVIELAWHADAPTRARYLAWANTTLTQLTTSYMYSPSANDAVLKNGTVTYPATDISIIYADYYLFEALMKMQSTPAEWLHEAARW